MNILYLLIPISILIVIAAVLAFRWAIKTRQFEDLESPALISLHDDPPEEQTSQNNTPPT